jgi:hypothetical protein
VGRATRIRTQTVVGLTDRRRSTFAYGFGWVGSPNLRTNDGWVGVKVVRRASRVRRTMSERFVTSSKVYSNTRSPRSWSSLRRWASRARSDGLAWPFWPETSTTTANSSKRKSTRATWRPSTRKTTCILGVGRPASRTSSRKRRSRWVWTPDSTIISSTSPTSPTARPSQRRQPSGEHFGRRQLEPHRAVDGGLDAMRVSPSERQVEHGPRGRRRPEPVDDHVIDRVEPLGGVDHEGEHGRSPRPVDRELDGVGS